MSVDQILLAWVAIFAVWLLAVVGLWLRHVITARHRRARW